MQNAVVRAGKEPLPVAQSGSVSGDKYTVLLLDESQLDRLLKRPGLSPVGRQAGRTITVWSSAMRRRTWLAAGVVLVLAASAVVWLRASAGGSMAFIPDSDEAPQVATAASFTVAVAPFANDDDALSLARRLQGLGLPAFTWRVDGTGRQVLLGPYVAIDEAERAQRAMARYGYRGTTLDVDERLRATGDGGRVRFDPLRLSTLAVANPTLLLVGTPGRWSLVFELDDEPRQVTGERLNQTAFDIRIRQAAPLPGGLAESQVWSVPVDVDLVQSIVVRPMAGGDPRELRARVTVAEMANASVRTVGRRVYVDVSPKPTEPTPERWSASVALAPPVAAPASMTARAPAPARSVPAPKSAAPPTTDAYRDAIDPVFARFEAIQPFLRSAVVSPTPDVLAALGGTFSELETSIQATVAPQNALASHGLLISAVQLARGAVAPSFAGDRVAQVREATAQFKEAKFRARN